MNGRETADGRLRIGLVVTAGGYGVRLGLGAPKQYAPILGVPMVQRTVAALDACPAVDALVVVVNAEDVEYCAAEIVAERFDKVVDIVGGGAERSLSVRNGLQALLAAYPELELLGVHDGARPLVTCQEVHDLRERLAADDDLAGALVAQPSADTLKMVDSEGLILDTPPRSNLWRAQTPQLFRRGALSAAYRQDDEVLRRATDDASLVERLGGRVAVVEGSPENLKVTTQLDLRLAEQILAERHR
jgi:2-C-methyl-D-erythritol 4-phosphate cytidylyltransferase